MNQKEQNADIIADFLVYNKSIFDEIKSESAELNDAINNVVSQLIKDNNEEERITPFKIGDKVIPLDKSFEFGTIEEINIMDNPNYIPNKPNLNNNFKIIFVYDMMTPKGLFIRYENEIVKFTEEDEYTNKTDAELNLMLSELNEFIELLDDSNDPDSVESESKIDQIEQELFNRKNK
tara:strand:- start:1881 stop:2414 length:534 start_codon:yes stop_codon:yes gene_type:complete